MAFPFAAIAGLASTVIGGVASAKGARDQNRRAQAAAQKQMDFQERMSSTSHQREVEDLRAAGLNPILSGTGGAGASSPGGAMPPVVDEITPGINTALAIKRQKQELKLMSATTANTRAALTGVHAQSERNIADATSAYALRDIALNNASISNIDYRNYNTIFGGQYGSEFKALQLLGAPGAAGISALRFLGKGLGKTATAVKPKTIRSLIRRKPPNKRPH